MGSVSTELIVLANTKVGDNGVVVHCICPVFGRKGLWVNAPKGSGRLSLLRPFNILGAEVSETPRSSLWKARNLSGLYPLTSLQTNLYKQSMVLFLSEVLFRLLREGSYEEGLYEWCKSSILKLDSLESDFSNFHLCFLIELSRALGYAPTLSDLAPFAEEELSNIGAMLRSSMAEALLLPLRGADRSKIAEALLGYIGYHTDIQLNIRSLAVLRELFV